MAGFFGTDEQRNLQARAEASVDEISCTAGLCQNGRMLGCDDIDALGWQRIREILQRDGHLGFRLIPSERETELSTKLAEMGFRFDTWNLFVASRDEAAAVCQVIIERPLPSGLSLLRRPDQAEDAYTLSIQRLIAAAGVVPFSGSLLVGSYSPARTVVVGSSEDEIAAAAHTYLPHNSMSRYRQYAWGGLVAVAMAYRGCGLGSYINAHAASAAFRDLDATHIYEMISSSNLASRRMAEACGLEHNRALLCGIAIHLGHERFTR